MDKSPSVRPSFQFGDVYTPAEVAAHFKNGDINRTDLLLIWAVASLYDPRHKGCFASNRYLAEAVGTVLLVASRSVQKLRKLNILVVRDKGGKRVMRTSWQGTVRKRVPPGFGGRKPPEKEGGGIPGGYTAPLYQKVDPPLYQKVEPLPCNSNKLKNPCCSQARNGVGGLETNGQGHRPLFPATPKAPPPWEQECSHRLHEALVKRNRLTRRASLAQWAAALRKWMAEGDHEVYRPPAEEFEAVLDWYCDHMGEPLLVDVRAMPTFCEAFHRIQAAKARRESPVGADRLPGWAP